MSKNDQDAVEAALVAALSELDNESDGEEDDAITQSQQQKIEEPPTIARSSSSNTTATSKVKFGPPLPPANDTNCKLRLSNLMETMLTVSDESEGGDAVDSEDVMMKAILQQMQSQLAQHDTSNDNSEQPSSSETMSHSDLDDAIEKMVHNMAIQASLNDDTNQSTNTTFSPDTSGAAELLEALKGLEIGIGDVDWNADAVIDGMMEQLLSKDFMYEPIKQVAERFPQWLEENQPYLPEKEYQARVNQSACFQRLVRAYETDPSNTKQFMEYMVEAQEFGQPPADLIKEIAPDLELDEHGMPKIDGMPLPNEECQIM